MEVSHPPDTASHIMVSASRIIEKLEIAYCMCLGFWTLGFWPNVAEKLMVRWDKLSFGLERFLALLRSLDLNVICNWCWCVPEVGPCCGHQFWTKKGQYGGTGVSGLGGDGRRMSVPRQRLGRVNEEGYVSGWENGGVRTWDRKPKGLSRLLLGVLEQINSSFHAAISTKWGWHKLISWRITAGENHTNSTLLKMAVINSESTHVYFSPSWPIVLFISNWEVTVNNLVAAM